MSENKTPPLSEIIAWMRKPHDEICEKCMEDPNYDCPFCSEPNGCNSPTGRWPGIMTELADQIDEAAKRERETASNAAKMREALEFIQENTYRDDLDDLREETGCKIEDVIDRALSAPPRNCDIGTAEEQIDRFYEFCQSHRVHFDEFWDCSQDCPVAKMIREKPKFCDNCMIPWMQMPYEEGGTE